ncbi:F-box/kelch-repeat protein At3g23880-like [Vigna radiata var. radiata]|uniref:F-box/kelch-repeat protein At3g23880-like n=1 Tax=Vigna radiata var. radiata TaxID=3916 RepID=A0A1S3UAA3_VIGRR|nr:F-box/kelch-repeat protein At3g23880-like [Vigna radiata var. radiata]
MTISSDELTTEIFFPDDLIIEILSWLPLKSVMRFKCVSKSWNSLIIDPYFVKLHRKRSIILQMELRKTVKTYAARGKNHMLNAITNSRNERRYGVSRKEAERGRECFRVAHTAAMKEALMEETAYYRPSNRVAEEDRPSLLWCMLGVVGLLLLMAAS